MASYRRLPSGLWQAQIFRRGVRESDSFQNKGAAIAWAGRREAEIMSGEGGSIPNLTVAALLTRYEKEVSEHKKGKRWEVVRLTLLGRDKLAQIRLRELDTPHLSDWQKRRLQAIKPASVRRERNLLNNVFNIAADEWKLIRKNPFGPRGRSVRRPKDSRPRNRVASPAEQATLLRAASPAMHRAITIALETAMRCKEIASNPPIRGNVAYLADDDSKTGEREVPLSKKALEAWAEPVELTAGSISTSFAKLCRAEKIKGLTFHDLKHTAMTRLSKRLDPWELAKMTGNKDMNIILNVYYKHDPEETAKKL